MSQDPQGHVSQRLAPSCSSVVLREAQTSDETRLAEVEWLTLGSAENVYRYQNILQRGRFYKEAVTIVGTADGRVICAITVALKPMVSVDGPCLVGHLFGLRVIPEFRRQGLARRLRDAAEDWLYRRGITDIYMLIHDGNQASLDLFTEAGYTPCGGVSFVAVDRPPTPLVLDDRVETGGLVRERAYARAMAYKTRPLDLERIFSPGRDGPYLGGFALQNAAGDESRLSVWDKDAALDRRRDDGRTAFAFDAKVSDLETWWRLVDVVLCLFPDVARLMFIVPEIVGAVIAADSRARLDRTELVVAKGNGFRLAMDDLYVDVRD